MKTLKECFITTERPYQEGTVEVFEQTVPAARRATLSITALGVYEARINGKKVGDHFLTLISTSRSRTRRFPGVPLFLN